MYEVLGAKITQRSSIEGRRNIRRIHMSMPRHIESLRSLIPAAALDQYGSMPQLTSMSTTFVGDGKILGVNDQSLYRKLVGAILYISSCRPDIGFAIGKLSRFVSCPTDLCLTAAYRLACYLLRTKNFGCVWRTPPNPDVELSSSSDSDWASCVLSRRSTTGYMITMSGPLSFKSKLQESVSLSSTEAETVALSNTCQENAALDKLFLEIEGSLPKLNLNEDNKGCRDIALNPGAYTRLKHVATRHFYCQEFIQKRKNVKLNLISTHSQVADILTKALNYNSFFDKRKMLMMEWEDEKCDDKIGQISE
jgi:hypothetical protein